MKLLVLAALYLSVSIAAFLIYAWDKHAARTGRRRIAEATLIALGMAGGWPGALAAQRIFRHKTRKRSFQAVFWGSVAMNILACLLLFRM